MEPGLLLVQSLSRVRLIATPWTAARQASLSITNSRSLLRLTSIESMMPSNHLILCCPLLLLRSIFPSIRVFSSELALCFYLLAFVNNAVVNTGVQISHGDPAFRSFGHIPRSGIAGSDCNSMLIFRGNTMLFSLVAAPFTFPPRVHRHFNSTTSTPAFSLLCFSLIVAILMGVSW